MQLTFKLSYFHFLAPIELESRDATRTIFLSTFDLLKLFSMFFVKTTLESRYSRPKGKNKIMAAFSWSILIITGVRPEDERALASK